jgi:hypothetical protein
MSAGDWVSLVSLLIFGLPLARSCKGAIGYEQ